MGNRFHRGASGEVDGRRLAVAGKFAVFYCPSGTASHFCWLLALVLSMCFRCMSFISGIEACSTPSVRPLGSVLYESGNLTVEGCVRFWVVSLRLPLHLLAFSLIFLHLSSIFKKLSFLQVFLAECMGVSNKSSVKSCLLHLSLFFFFFFFFLFI